MRLRGFVGIAMAAVLLGAGPVAVVAVDAAPASTCKVVAGTPYSGGGALVSGNVGRTGCPSNKQTISKLIHSRPWMPDVVVASNTKEIRNTTYTLSARRTAGHGYITESKASDGGYARSGVWKAP